MCSASCWRHWASTGEDSSRSLAELSSEMWAIYIPGLFHPKHAQPCKCYSYSLTVAVAMHPPHAHTFEVRQAVYKKKTTNCCNKILTKRQLVYNYSVPLLCCMNINPIKCIKINEISCHFLGSYFSPERSKQTTPCI